MKNKIENVKVFNQACPLLAPMAEEGWTENEIARLTLIEYLKNFENLDALILGCTHYPLFEKLIEEILPNVKIINTGKVIAKYLDNKYESKQDEVEDEFYLSDTQCNFIDVADKILNKKIEIREM